MIPVYFDPAEDEYLLSWVHALRKGNGIDMWADFWCAFIEPNQVKKQITYVPDGRIRVVQLWRGIAPEQSLSDFFLRTTCYGAMAPMLPSERQTKLLNAACRPLTNRQQTRIPDSCVLEVCRCPQCMGEDIVRYGRWYLHRTHQLPGVFVCHKHGCALERLIGSDANKFMSGKYETITSSVPLEFLRKVSQFAADMLEKAPDGSMECTKVAIITKIKELGYYSPQNGYAALAEKVKLGGFGDYFPNGVSAYLKEGMWQVSYAPIPATLALLTFLYGNVESFQSDLEDYCPVPDFSWLEDTDFVLLGTPRSSILELEDKACGYHFCLNAKAVRDGWGCPRCDCDTNVETSFRRILQVAGKGEYTLISDFVGMERRVRLEHCCGRQFDVLPRRFAYEGTRCTCVAHESLLSLSGSLSRAKVIGDKIMKELGDEKVCEPPPGSDEELSPSLRIDKAARFAKKVRSLTGDSYYVLDSYKDTHTPITLLHTECGQAQTYYPNNFLRGQRCKYCTPRATHEFLAAAIPKLSMGEYSFVDREGKQKVRVRRAADKKEWVLPQSVVMQELMRTTPSSIFSNEKERDTSSVYVVEMGARHTLWNRLEAWQERGKFVFLDEFDESEYRLAKDALAHFVSSGVLLRVEPGVYTWPDTTYTLAELIEEKYCRRSADIIGYEYGRSFAYRLGLSNQCPTVPYFVSNKASQRHGRIVTTKEYQVYVRSGIVPVCNSNWKALQLLDFLPCLGRYISCSQDEAHEVLGVHAKREGINRADVEPYLQYYPCWVSQRISDILE